MQRKVIETDVVIVGGGTAGCYAAMTIAEQSDYRVVVVEKAHIKRSGCLAAGVNALNAYIVKGQKPEDYVAYARKDAEGIVRGDLLLSMSKGLNKVTKRLEDLGLVILKDENGEYVARGNRNIKINGENIKPILAKAVTTQPKVQVLEQVSAIDYKVEEGQIVGVYAIGVEEEVFYSIQAKAVICTTGGASGIYRPNNPGFSKHKMWYSPFNTGAGYAMGIRAGAEMTTFEMRFIALRCKDTISPTGTIAQGVGAKQVNSLGEIYEQKYGLTTSERVYGTVKENEEGRGPCYLKTEGIDETGETELLKAYLNMSPAQTLKWIESGKGPSKESVEIEGTEPYIIGGHTASGYWIDDKRATTLKGLYAAGDVAGGCPQKYVTGALVEGEIAAQSAIDYIKELADSKQIEREKLQQNSLLQELEAIEDRRELNNKDQNINGTDLSDLTIFKEIEKLLNKEATNPYTTAHLEEAMQKVMDAYAGGITSHYRYNEKQLNVAEKKLKEISELTEALGAKDAYELTKLYELKDRLLVARVLIAHLKARKETRWHSFAEHADYPEKDDTWLKYVNSKWEDGKARIILRDLVKEEEHYEHFYS